MPDILTNIILPIVLAIFGSSGFWAFIQTKYNKSKEILETVQSLKNEVTTIKADLKNLKDDNLKTKAETARTRINRFADELRNGVKRSQDSFKEILIDVDFYEKYCAEHPDFPNSASLMSVKKIKDHYAADDFL